jgi:hypothetical protein
MRDRCDRLVLGFRGPAGAALDMAEDAALAGVDLICLVESASDDQAIRQLRPDIVIDPAALSD